MTGLLVALVLSASIRLECDRPSLVLDAHDTARIHIFVRDAGAAIPELFATAGTLSRVTREEEGEFVATYLPPRETWPQLALIGARINGKALGWLSLALYGKATLKFATRPRTTLQVQLGDQLSEAVRADGTGKASTEVTVPPGIDEATVKFSDTGLSVRKPIAHPPVGRLALATVDVLPSASWVDARPLAFEVFARLPNGSESTEPPVVSVDVGSVELEPREAGVWAGRYHAAELIGAGVATLRAELGSTTQEVKIALKPGSMDHLALEVDRRQVVAAANLSLTIRARVVDAKGNDSPLDPERLKSDFGTLGALAENGSVSWRLPPFFGGRAQTVLVAALGSQRLELKVGLQPGPPARVVVSVPAAEVVAGTGGVEGTVELFDAFANPADGALRVESSFGTLEAVEQLAPPRRGAYRVRFRFPESEVAQTAQVVARAGEVVGTGEVRLSATPSPLVFEAGAVVRGQSNFQRASGGTPMVELSLHRKRWALQPLLRAGASFFANASEQLAASEAATKVTQALGPTLELGLRYRLWSVRTIDLHATAAVGVRATSTRIVIHGGSADGVAQEASTFDAVLTLGAAATLPLGPGRAVAELSGMYSGTRGQVTGNLGGAAFSLGYLFAFP